VKDGNINGKGEGEGEGEGECRKQTRTSRNASRRPLECDGPSLQSSHRAV
jgi:hypothetical protein